VVATAGVAAALEVREGEHLLVADDAAGLAAAIVTLLRDPARARAMADAAHAVVGRRYEWSASARAVEAAWEEAVAGYRDGAPCAPSGV
jgi:glycosyltransferase involved in cell wall biosynthesis